MEKTLPEVRKAELPHIDRSSELAWLQEHGEEYAGQWVVLDGDELLGSGDDPRSLVEEARAKGHSRPLVVHVPKDNAPSMGGWL